jgi:hypothetical protein
MQKNVYVKKLRTRSNLRILDIYILNNIQRMSNKNDRIITYPRTLSRQVLLLISSKRM